MNLSRRLATILGAAILAGGLFMAPAAQAHVFVSVGIAPPAIPVYAQPVAPGDGYIWTPGYWAWTDQGYQWVDGAWVLPPYEGALWTPGYWGYGSGSYLWNAGYWGPVVGYYGGINYGFGYFGTGFYGGYWGGGRFWYNRPYNNIAWGHGFHSFYNNPVHGFDGRPGGSSWTNRVADNTNRGSFATASVNRGSNNFAQRSSGYNQAANSRSTYNGGGNVQHNFAGSNQSSNYAQPRNGYNGSSYRGNTTMASNYHASMPSGGSTYHGSTSSFHGGGGGGGSFHGGGGGGHGHR